jgi:hypothetical protein
MKGIFNLHTGGHVIKIALMGQGYTYAATHVNWTDSGVSSNEIASGNGYTTGGATITTSVSGTTSAAFNTSGDIVWSNSTISAYGAIIYDSTATNSPLIAWIDFGGVQSSSNGNFTISWTSQGNIIVSIA